MNPALSFLGYAGMSKESTQFLSLRYRCPITAASLRFAPRGDASCENLLASINQKVSDWDGLLITERGDIAYHVIRGIPQLMSEMALPQKGYPNPNMRDYELISRVRTEYSLYDGIAERKLQHIERHVESVFGKRLAGPSPILPPEAKGFPQPVGLWIDAHSGADTQFCAYAHLAPLVGKVFLQFGGTGSHAIKALLAGAASACLLSPSQRELELGITLAEHRGVASRFTAIRGIGEQIPLEDNTLDCIYGGGCLHHTDITRSLPEIARVLRPGSRAAFVDPLENPIYKLWTCFAGRYRFCAEEDEALDHPLRLEDVRHAAVNCDLTFHDYCSGGILRFGLVFLERVLGVRIPVTLCYRILRSERVLLRSLRMEALLTTVALLLIKEGQRAN